MDAFDETWVAPADEDANLTEVRERFLEALQDPTRSGYALGLLHGAELCNGLQADDLVLEMRALYGAKYPGYIESRRQDRPAQR